MFSSKDYWEKRYSNGGNSGSGSYGRLAEFKTGVINWFCDEYNISKIVEWGCGDGNNCAGFNVGEYVGYDVSETAITICQKRISKPNRKFICYNGEVLDAPEKGQLSLSLDVLYHLVENQAFENYMKNLFNSSSRYVGIYSYDGEMINLTAEHVKYREHSTYIKERFPEYVLMQVVKNEYKRDEKTDPETTSWCDFYFYEKK